jgi:hypothetical protein
MAPRQGELHADGGSSFAVAEAIDTSDSEKLTWESSWCKGLH